MKASMLEFCIIKLGSWDIKYQPTEDEDTRLPSLGVNNGDNIAAFHRMWNIDSLHRLRVQSIRTRSNPRLQKGPTTSLIEK